MTEAPGIVDWAMARRVGRALATGEQGSPSLAADQVGAVCDDALARVLEYTGLTPRSEIPSVEVVSRAEWIGSNLDELRELAAPIEARASREISLPWPVEGVARAALGAASGVEVGVVVGYASRRVLGQYQVALTPRPKPPRMLLVGPNLAGAASELGADPDRFLRWVAIHEQTHSAQFASVPWLREHLAGLVEGVIETAASGIDLKALVAAARRLMGADPRKALRDALRGELTRALAGPQQAAVLDEIQAVMAVIEGYAEHVMDAAARDDEGLASMRERMDARRSSRGGLADMIARVLGMGMKLRQYELGKAWSDAVAAEAGIQGLNRTWSGPDALPTLAELERPERWLERVGRTPAPA